MANTLKLGAGKWATGTDTVLAFNDENNNFKPLPFSFSRASSATVVNQSGLIETVGSGTPRIDFLGNTKGALLLEPSRTNLITYSEDFSQSAWVKSGTSVVSGFISPDGTNNAFKLVEGTTNSDHSIYATFTSLPSGIYTISAYVKKGERHKCALADRNSGIYVSFDLNNITVIAQGGMIGNIELLSNGWFKLSATTSNALTIIVPQIFILEDSYTTGLPIFQTYAGDGTSGVYIFGASLESGSYATSYIPTSGSAVTRVGESTIQDLSNVVSLTEGVIYIDTTNLGNDGTSSNIISQNSVVDTVFCLKVGSNNKILMGLFASSTNVSITSASSYALGARTKIALHYKSGNMSLYVNGSLEGTNNAAFTLGSGFATALRLIDTSSAYNAFPSKSIAREFKVYNTGLTSAELQALTTI